MSEIISAAELRQLVGEWLVQGRRVIGPARIKPERVLFVPLRDAGQLLLDDCTRPANSAKEAVFPRHEKLYEFRFQGKQIEILDAPPPAASQVVIGARPCDAAALPILDRVFNWDCRDAHYNRRRDLTTLVTLACRQHDRHCFCTSLGSGPDDPRGSDAMLYRLGDGSYEVRTLTEKGSALFASHTHASDQVGLAGPGPQPVLDPDAVGTFLRTHFEDPRWARWSARCLGCGACACTCPTCHCFDMVDEGGAAGGAKVRNWDACQHALFTLHASGHNPRGTQWQRQRQRVYHKFHIYPQKFGAILCTGCGNCTRNCPVQLGLLPVLNEIQGSGRIAPSKVVR